MLHEPLLPKGDHELTLEQVYSICVEGFTPINERREHLFVQFTDFLIYFRELGFRPHEIWIDGSFVTKKPDPGDIDLLIVLNMGEVAQLPRAVQDMIFAEFGRGPASRKFECDAHLAPSTDGERIKYYLNLFRNLSNKNTFKKKGIIKLKMP
ncbi:MAG TPA: hypothetical protein VHS96_03375 [Bacteroidia bacterium]|nr:hypothetical protein [Bacteroidia bacterium]